MWNKPGFDLELEAKPDTASQDQLPLAQSCSLVFPQVYLLRACPPNKLSAFNSLPGSLAQRTHAHMIIALG